MSPLVELIILCPLLCLIQVLVAWPWLALVDPTLKPNRVRQRKGLLTTLLVIIGIGVAAAFYLNANRDPEVLGTVGRIYGAVLQLQLTADLFILVFAVLLYYWPKGAAVALAAFREGVRQPMFWVLVGAGILLLGISPFLPYFTFGEDLKMLKDLAYLTIFLVTALFGILSASMSISEEIEGRTAVTVMSKPIARRHFLLGKFFGILMTCALITFLLGWLMVWIILFKEAWDPPLAAQPEPDPLWIVRILNTYFAEGPSGYFFRGLLLWSDNIGQAYPGLVITFCQVMILLAIAVAFATRLPMIVNALICLAIFFLGNLTPILTAVSQDQYPLIKFIAGVFDTILPGLDMFDMGPAVVRYAPLPAAEFALYTLNVALYAVVYTAVALLFGLILFEDRDVA